MGQLVKHANKVACIKFEKNKQNDFYFISIKTQCLCPQFHSRIMPAHFWMSYWNGLASKSVPKFAFTDNTFSTMAVG
jgi:hypothetical protein